MRLNHPFVKKSLLLASGFFVISAFFIFSSPAFAQTSLFFASSTSPLVSQPKSVSLSNPANAWTFSENFNNLAIGDLNGQNGWQQMTGQFLVEAGTAYEGSRAIVSSSSYAYYLHNLSVNEDGNFYVAVRNSAGNQSAVGLVNYFGCNFGWATFDSDGYLKRYINGANPTLETLGPYNFDTWYLLNIAFRINDATYAVRYRSQSGNWSDWSSYQMYRPCDVPLPLTALQLWTTGSNDYFDFISPTENPPAVLTVSGLQQLKSDGTILNEGGTTTENTVTFKALLQSSAPDPLRLEVQASTSADPADYFANPLSVTSSVVSTNLTAVATLQNLTDGSYHWRARVVDTVTNTVSGWQEFGTPGNVDFIVQLPTPTPTPTPTPQPPSVNGWTYSQTFDRLNSGSLNNQDNWQDSSGSFQIGASQGLPAQGSQYAYAILSDNQSQTAQRTIDPVNSGEFYLWLQHGPDYAGRQASNSNVSASFLNASDGNGFSVSINSNWTGPTYGGYFADSVSLSGIGGSSYSFSGPGLGVWSHIRVQFSNSWARFQQNSGAGWSGWSDWVYYGGNAINLIKFSASSGQHIYGAQPADLTAKWDYIGLTENTPPPSLSNQGQFRADESTPIAEGMTTTENTVVFKADVSSPVGNQVKLQVELRKYSQPFTGLDDGGILASNWVDSGHTAVIPRPGLNDGQYKWRARAVDSQGNVSSDWQNAPEYGTAGNVDFAVNYVRQIKIAVILAQPSDVPHYTGIVTQPCKLLNASSTYSGYNKAYYEALAYCVTDYYRENSYGKINLNFTIFDNGGNWYNTQHSSLTYYDSIDGTVFVRDAVNQASTTENNLSSYDMVGVVRSGERLTLGNQKKNGQWHPKNQAYPLSPGDPNGPSDGYLSYKFLVSGDTFTGSWAHEIGHDLGSVLNNNPVCDLHQVEPGYCGGSTVEDTAIGFWDLMGRGSLGGNPLGFDPTSFSSFSKIWLKWLREDPIDLGFNGAIESLETMKFGDKVKRYNTTDDSYYLFETRTRRPEFSRWDDFLPMKNQDALVVYKTRVETINSRPTPILNLMKVLNTNDFYCNPFGGFAVNTNGYTADILNKSFKINTQLNPCSESRYVATVLEPDNSLLKQTGNLSFSFAESLEDWLKNNNVNPQERFTSNEVLVSTDKNFYRQNHYSRLILNIRSNSDNPIWYTYFSSVLEKKNQQGQWDVVTRWLGAAEDVSNVFLEIRGKDTGGMAYDVSPGGDIKESGVYRITVGYTFTPQPREGTFNETPRIADWKTLKLARSNEFTVEFGPQSTATPSPSIPSSFSVSLMSKLSKSVSNPAFLIFLAIVTILFISRFFLKKLLSRKSLLFLTIFLVLFLLLLIFYLILSVFPSKVQSTPLSLKVQYKSLMSFDFPEFIPGHKYETLDLDLHAITPDGKHVGMNYQTGEYENQIPGAIASGNLIYDDEWIFVPQNTEVKFYVSSYPIKQFFDENPALAQQFSSTQDNYDLSAIYYDANSQKYTSRPLQNQTISPGQNVFYQTQGTTNISIAPIGQTSLSYLGDTSGLFSDSVNLKAKLTDNQGQGIVGKAVVFSFFNKSISATTDSQGLASATLTINSIPKTLTETYPINISFAGDSSYLTSTATSNFTLKSSQWLKQDAVSNLTNAKTGDQKTDAKIDSIISAINKSLDKDLWPDASHLTLLVKGGCSDSDIQRFDPDNLGLDNLFNLDSQGLDLKTTDLFTRKCFGSKPGFTAFYNEKTAVGLLTNLQNQLSRAVNSVFKASLGALAQATSCYYCNSGSCAPVELSTFGCAMLGYYSSFSACQASCGVATPTPLPPAQTPASNPENHTITPTPTPTPATKLTPTPTPVTITLTPTPTATPTPTPTPTSTPTPILTPTPATSCYYCNVGSCAPVELSTFGCAMLGYYSNLSACQATCGVATPTPTPAPSYWAIASLAATPDRAKIQSSGIAFTKGQVYSNFSSPFLKGLQWFTDSVSINSPAKLDFRLGIDTNLGSLSYADFSYSFWCDKPNDFSTNLETHTAGQPDWQVSYGYDDYQKGTVANERQAYTIPPFGVCDTLYSHPGHYTATLLASVHDRRIGGSTVIAAAYLPITVIQGSPTPTPAPVPPSVITAVTGELVKADSLLAKVSLTDAQNAPIKNPKLQKIVQNQIQRAIDEIANANKLITTHPDQAITKFAGSWLHSQLAIRLASSQRLLVVVEEEYAASAGGSGNASPVIKILGSIQTFAGNLISQFLNAILSIKN